MVGLNCFFFFLFYFFEVMPWAVPFPLRLTMEVHHTLHMLAYSRKGCSYLQNTLNNQSQLRIFLILLSNEESQKWVNIPSLPNQNIVFTGKKSKPTNQKTTKTKHYFLPFSFSLFFFFFLHTTIKSKVKQLVWRKSIPPCFLTHTQVQQMLSMHEPDFRHVSHLSQVTPLNETSE